MNATQVAHTKTLQTEDRIRSNSSLLTEQMRWLETLPVDFQTILDVGCGAGFHAKWFHGRGHKVTATDWSTDAFLFADEIEAVASDILQYLPTKEYDAIVCSHVLEHFADPGTLMRKLRSLLKPGGYLFLVVPGYTPLSCNGHWHTGWNITQLGGWLVSMGFDCREGTFAHLGINVCGFGRKSDEVPSDAHFDLPRILRFMPAPFKKAEFFQGTDHLLRADLTWVDADMCE